MFIFDKYFSFVIVMMFRKFLTVIVFSMNHDFACIWVLHSRYSEIDHLIERMLVLFNTHPCFFQIHSEIHILPLIFIL